MAKVKRSNKDPLIRRVKLLLTCIDEQVNILKVVPDFDWEESDSIIAQSMKVITREAQLVMEYITKRTTGYVNKQGRSVRQKGRTG